MFSLTVIRFQPGEQDLANKQAELDRIEHKIIRQQHDLDSLRTEIAAFYARYSKRVGPYYEELSGLPAKIAELWQENIPKELFEEMRESFEANAREEARAHNARLEDEQPTPKAKAPDDIRRVYRMACQRIHPDRAKNDVDRGRRTRFMAEITRAYREGNIERIQTLLVEYEADAETAETHDFGSRLMQLLCRIAEATLRFKAIKKEYKELKRCEMNRFRRAIEADEARGGDPIGDLVRSINAQIREARAQLREMRRA